MKFNIFNIYPLIPAYYCLDVKVSLKDKLYRETFNSHYMKISSEINFYYI